MSGVIASLVWGRVKAFLWGYILGAVTGGAALSLAMPTILTAIKKWMGT
jgi:hypothetical protein